MAKKVKSLTKNSKGLRHKFEQGGKSNASTNPDRIVKGNTDGKHNSLRSKATIKRLKMYDQKMPNMQKMHERPTDAPRIDPNRKWFGNVRTIDQKALEKLRIEVAKKDIDPSKILVKAKQLPTSLLNNPIKENKVRLLEVETYEVKYSFTQQTFGPNKRRKKMKLTHTSMDQLIQEVQHKEYDLQKDTNIVRDDQDRPENRDKRMSAGQSRRIWDQLHKVLDSSDVVVQVLDARDPLGTRSMALEEHIKKNCPHKHVVLLLNKADLVPVWVVAKWVKHLSKEFPTIAYRSSITNPFGKGSLINLFRQFDIFHRDKKNISIGFVGYPNVGKSSVINSLKERKVCKAAPVPGETRVWQYISLTKRIYLIDCPGTVHSTEGKDDVDSVLKGCVRAQKIDDPTYYVEYILNKVNSKYLHRTYGVKEWEDCQDFVKKQPSRKVSSEREVNQINKQLLSQSQLIGKEVNYHTSISLLEKQTRWRTNMEMRLQTRLKSKISQRWQAKSICITHNQLQSNKMVKMMNKQMKKRNRNDVHLFIFDIIMMLFRRVWLPLRNKQKQKRTTPNNTIQPRSIPLRAAKGVQLMKEIREMHVSSEVMDDQKYLKEKISAERQSLKQLDQKIFNLPFNKIIAFLTGFNLLGYSYSMIFDKSMIGSLMVVCIHPSFIAVSSMLIGSNIAMLIINHSLNLHLSNQELDKLNTISMINTPWNNVFHLSKAVVDIGCLTYFLGNMLIQKYNTPLLLGYVLFGIFLPIQTYLLVPKSMKIFKKKIIISIMGYLLILGIYLIALDSEQQILKQGFEKVDSLLKLKKYTIADEPINISLQESTQQLI